MSRQLGVLAEDDEEMDEEAYRRHVMDETNYGYNKPPIDNSVNLFVWMCGLLLAAGGLLGGDAFAVLYNDLPRFDSKSYQKWIWFWGWGFHALGLLCFLFVFGRTAYKKTPFDHWVGIMLPFAVILCVGGAAFHCTQYWASELITVLKRPEISTLQGHIFGSFMLFIWMEVLYWLEFKRENAVYYPIPSEEENAEGAYGRPRRNGKKKKIPVSEGSVNSVSKNQIVPQDSEEEEEVADHEECDRIMDEQEVTIIKLKSMLQTKNETIARLTVELDKANGGHSGASLDITTLTDKMHAAQVSRGPTMYVPRADIISRPADADQMVAPQINPAAEVDDIDVFGKDLGF